MIVKRGSGDLNRIYRPCKISEFIGHSTIKNMIENALKKNALPHAMLFIGTSGCGKTTMARLIALGLNCVEGPTSEPCCKCASCKSILDLNSFAVMEIDAGRAGDVNNTRKVLDDLPAAPMGGEPYKVAIFDEAHKLGGSSGSEDALLKFLEDTPNHVYIILCTNEYQKLKEVTRNRCKTYQFSRLTDSNIYQILEEVSQFEGYSYNTEILKYIVEESNGVPRASLSFLQQIASEGSWTKEAASLIVNMGVDVDHANVLNLCKVLLIKHNFKEVLGIYKEIKNIPIEIIRMGVCGYFVGCLKRSRNSLEAEKFSRIIDMLENPYFNNPKPEHKLINTFFKITQILRRSST